MFDVTCRFLLLDKYVTQFLKIDAHETITIVRIRLCLHELLSDRVILYIERVPVCRRLSDIPGLANVRRLQRVAFAWLCRVAGRELLLPWVFSG